MEIALECLQAGANPVPYLMKGLREFEQDRDAENARYFYHTDHLGSSSWITNAGGQALQHFTYLPFGEPWVDQRATGWSARYTFSGKERDVETGYGYFGARYYSSDLSIWLSVDPQAARYPSLSPYVYCANNPVMLVDPDGESIILLVSLGIAAGIGAYQGYKAAQAAGATGWSMAGYMLGGAVIGAVAGGVGAGGGMAVGGALAAAGIGGFAGGAITGAVSGFAAGAIGGLGMGGLSGQTGADLWKATLVSAAIGLGSGALLGGTLQGIASAKQGNNFWSGKSTATPAPATYRNSSSTTGTQQANPQAQNPMSPKGTYQNPTPADQNSYFIQGIEKRQYHYIERNTLLIVETPRPGIKGYLPSVLNKADLSHEFPFIFDDFIVNEGAFSLTTKGDYWYIAPGSINTRSGWYSIGMHPDGTIFHRCFPNYYPYAK